MAAAQLALALGALILIGCGSGLRGYSAREKKVAPQSSSQVGLIVDRLQEKQLVEVLETHTEARYRSLHPKTGLYEVWGVDREQLRAIAPNARVEPNYYFHHNMDGMDSRRDRRFQSLAQGFEAVEGVNKCADGGAPPEAKIGLVSPAMVDDQPRFRRGETLRLSSGGSIPAESTGGELRAAWLVVSPAGAIKEEQIHVGRDLTLPLEAMGRYMVALVVQDRLGVCGSARFDLAVTANDPYSGKGSPDGDRKVPLLDAEKLYHLKLVRAQESWERSKGQGVKVAVVDSGVNYNHPELRDRISVNAREIPGNGIDDDQNGLVDDAYGYDFQNGDAFAFDDVGHGSHVAGLVAGLQTGVATQAEILPIKALGVMGGDVGSVAASILYAVDQGAQIVNLSLGSYAPPSLALLRAAHYAEAHGVVLVGAAGNGHPIFGMGMDVDSLPTFPAALPFTNVIAVASRGSSGPLAVYSNFGANSVHVVAPGGGGEGDGLLSAYLDNPAGVYFKEMSGTSMAAPVVSAIVAQILALRPEMRPMELRRLLLLSGTEVPELKPFIVSGRHLDARSALELATSHGAAATW